MPVTNYCNKSMARGFYGIDRSQKRRQSDGEQREKEKGTKTKREANNWLADCAGAICRPLRHQTKAALRLVLGYGVLGASMTARG